MTDVKVEQCDKEAAFTLLVGKKVGGGDGDTYVARFPSLREVEAAFARHRQAAEKATREQCAKVVEQFPLDEDHPDAGVMGCRDIEIATAIRSQNDD